MTTRRNTTTLQSSNVHPQELVLAAMSQ